MSETASAPMKIGVTIFATDRTADVTEVCREAEARGIQSFWLPEHTHIPTSRLTPPPTGEPELPEPYRRTLDPLVALAACASVTRTIRLGTGIMLAAQREPIVTAKALATLDHLSGGRVDLGVGFGWNEDEMANHGVARAERWAIAREHVEAMQALWRHDVVGYEGAHVAFTESWSHPKPVTGDIPVLIGGGSGPKLFAHAVDYAAGWIPIGGAGLAEAIPRLHAELEDAGRDPAGFRIVPFGSLPTPGKLEHFARIGVTEVVCRIPGGARDPVLSALDEVAEVWASVS